MFAMFTPVARPSLTALGGALSFFILGAARAEDKSLPEAAFGDLDTPQDYTRAARRARSVNGVIVLDDVAQTQNMALAPPVSTDQGEND